MPAVLEDPSKDPDPPPDGIHRDQPAGMSSTGAQVRQAGTAGCSYWVARPVSSRSRSPPLPLPGAEWRGRGGRLRLPPGFGGGFRPGFGFHPGFGSRPGSASAVVLAAENSWRIPAPESAALSALLLTSPFWRAPPPVTMRRHQAGTGRRRAMRRPRAAVGPTAGR